MLPGSWAPELCFLENSKFSAAELIMGVKKIKKLGVITSGGDCSGMNAALRSVVRCALYNDIETIGFYRAYLGLVNNEKINLTRRSVSNVIGRGGTILKTERFLEFKEKKWQKKAKEVLHKNKIDALVVIGGDGSFRGAHALSKSFGIQTIGIPATIDNDISGTDYSIGSFTAVNVALDAIDKIRDTATSMERIFVIEVMGRSVGFIAMLVGLAGGAEEVLLPELNTRLDDMIKEIKAGRKKGKRSWIVIVAEGAYKADYIADFISEQTGFETRVAVLGHVQRGGTPTAFDRVLASRFGAYAVELAMNKNTDCSAAIQADKLKSIPLSKAIKPSTTTNTDLYELMKILAA